MQNLNERGAAYIPIAEARGITPHSDKTENRGTHGVSSSMLDTLVSSSENPLSLDMGSVNSRVYVHGK